MRILALETSCDETAAAVVENGTKIFSSVVATSADLHIKTGGIVPEVAAREQVKCIIPVIKETMKQLNKETIDALAVTIGPGLIGSLLVGVETAKTLAFAWNKPIIPVNHLVGHIYAHWFDENRKPSFPALCLVVSGGHTELVLMKNYDKLKYLGGTRDDAAGECFDKTARLLGLSPYNGGPAIAKAAEKHMLNSLPYTVKLPRPMIGKDNLDFSFSGLKTAVLRPVEKAKANKTFDTNTIDSLAYEIQEAISDVLVAKVIKAVEIYKPKSVLLAGGVAANQRLREKLIEEIRKFASGKFSSEKEKLVIELFVPPPQLCTDNAAYIASCAYFNYHPVPWQKIMADPGLAIV